MKNSLIHRAAVALRRGGHDTKQAAAKQALNRREPLVLPLLSVLVIGSTVAATALAAPSATDILTSAREQVARQQVELDGQLREGDTIIPFRLTQSGPVIRYTFTDPTEALQLRLGDAGPVLEAITGDGVDKIAGAEFNQRVRNTAITYEDLALRFVYWSNAKVVGEDYINTRRVWKLELLPPDRASQYSRVFVWCEQESRVRIADRTADFAYLRCKNLVSAEPTGYPPDGIERIAGLCRAWAAGEAPEGLPYAGDPAESRGHDGDVFAFMINGAKERAPAAAQALAQLVG